MKVARAQFERVHQAHWAVECYHRALKGVCHAERFFVRWKRAIRNHLFCALRAFVYLEEQLSKGTIRSWYELKRHVSNHAVSAFIQRRVAAHTA
jgi:hypothetical protein